MKKELFEGEQILTTWNACTLTNKRVWRLVQGNGRSEYSGFPLSQFQGAIVGKRSFPWLLYIGIAFFVLSLLAIAGEEGKRFAMFFAPCLFGCVFLALWHFTKRAQVFFCSGEVKMHIQIHANNQDYDAAVKFISEVEAASTGSRLAAASAA